MMPMDTNVLLVGGLIIATVFVMVAVLTTVSRFYRRCGADEALVRTGAGGNKVVIGGGILVYPILHQLLRVSLRSVKLSVERSEKNALVTADKIKANVITELYIKVEPIAEDVLAAARSFGERNLDEHAIADLIEGKLTDALRSVAANQTFMSLHANRKQFAERIQEVLSEELKKNGLTLENVSITAFAMVPVKVLDPQDVFDAEGLRAITESVQTNREQTNRIQREKDNLIIEQNVVARKRQLELEQAQKQAEADQARRVAEYGAIQSAETAKAVFTQERDREIAALDKARAVATAQIAQEQAVAVALAGKQRAEREAQIEAEKGQQTAEIARARIIEAAEIEKDKTVQAAEIDRQRALEAATIEKEKAVEVARINKEIAIKQGEEAEARAAAAMTLARAEHEKARQAVVTVETTAQAERQKAVLVIQAQGQADILRQQAQAKADAAKKEAEAAELLARAVTVQGEAQAQARRRMIDAENAVSSRVILREVAVKALEVAPEVTRELMSPAKAIREIRVLQTNGMGSGAGAEGGTAAFGSMSPILKTLMEAGAAYPMLRELMKFGQVDGDKLASGARSLLQELGGELGKELGEEGKPAEEAGAKDDAHDIADLVEDDNSVQETDHAA